MSQAASAVVTDAWVRTKVGSFVVSSAATLFVTKKLPPPGALHQFVEQLSPPDRAHFESLSKHESARKMKFTKAMIWVLQKLDGELSLNLTFQNRGARMAKGQIAAVRDKVVDYRGNLFEEPTVSAAAREAAQASHAKAMHKQAVKAVKQADLGALRSFLQLNQQILLNESVRDSLDGQNAKLKSSTTHLTNPLLLHDCSTTYGEFTLGRFVNVLIAYFEHRLSHVSWPRFHGFLDIGSGTGGPVIVVSHLAQLLRIRHCKGVEIGRYRYDASLGRAQQAADRQLLAAPTEFVYSYAEELTYRFLADVQFFYSFDWAMKAFRGGILQHMVRMKWFGVDVDEEIEQPSMPRRAQVESLYYATCMPLREMRSELKESGTGYKPSLVFKQLMKLAGSKNTPTLYLYYLEGVPS